MKARVECINRPAGDRPDISVDNHIVPVPSAHLNKDRPTKVRCLSTQSALYRRESQPVSMNQIVGRTPPSESPVDTPDENVGFVELTEKDMNTQLFTLTRGHLMAASTSNPQQRDNGADSVHWHHNLISGNEYLSSPSASSFIDPQYRAVLPWSYSRASANSLLANLPPRRVTDYLVAVYFNTVHWFMAILHEGHFLHHYRKMMDLYERDAQSTPNTDEDFTFAVLVLTIVALGGRYTSIHAARVRRCNQTYMDFCRAPKPYGTPSLDPQDFDVMKNTSQLFSVVRSNATDNLACGTLATIQSLLLLGSLYLFHGDANLAWANSGSVIRAAQALGVHKECSELRWNSPYYQSMDRAERRQLRWRLFWAVHTSDRFLSMCYGLPLLILDEDCTAGVPCEDNIYPPPGSSSFLMIEDDLHDLSPASLSNNSSRPITLLTYQTYKLQFYIILGEITSTIYRRPHGGFESIVSKFESRASAKASSGSELKGHELIEAVQKLEHKLRKWYDDIPKALRLSKDLTYPPFNQPVDNDDDQVIIPADDDLCKDPRQTKKRRTKVKNTIYGIQALLLQVAYDNALILIHRPILALKKKSLLTASQEIHRRSINACWDASLRISNIGKHHVFNRNQQAHAISYVGIHLFTAGAVLSAFASSEPLSRCAWEAKQGLSRVIRMQHRLRRKVLVSGQGLTILESLAQEVVRKEMKTIIAQETEILDDDDQTMSLENVRPTDSVINDRMSTGTSAQVAELNTQRQQYMPPVADEAVNYAEASTGLPLDLNDDIESDFFNNSMLELNESMLDIEKCTCTTVVDRFLGQHLTQDAVLSEPQPLPVSVMGMNINGSWTNNEPQQTPIWWFSYDQ